MQNLLLNCDNGFKRRPRLKELLLVNRLKTLASKETSLCPSYIEVARKSFMEKESRT